MECVGKNSISRIHVLQVVQHRRISLVRRETNSSFDSLLSCSNITAKIVKKKRLVYIGLYLEVNNVLSQRGFFETRCTGLIVHYHHHHHYRHF